MPYGQEIAGVLPSEQQTPLQTYAQSMDRMQRKKLLEEEKATRLAEQKRQNRLGAERYLDEAFDFSKIKTGLVDQDQLLLNQQSALRQQAEQSMYANDLSEAELRSMMRNGLMEINAMSEVTKAARDKIDLDLKPYADSKSLDLQRMRDGAMRRTFFDTDPNGQQIQRKVGDIKPYDIAKMIGEKPGDFVLQDRNSGDVVHGDLDQYIKDQKPTLKTEEVYRDYQPKGGGRMEQKKEKLSVMKLIGQEVVWKKNKDKDGKEIDTPELEFKTETTLDENKKPVKMLNSDSYNQYFGSKGARAALEAETTKRNDGKELDYNSAQGQRALRVTALDLLNKRATGTSVGYAEEKILQGLPNYNSGGSGASSSEKKEKTQLEKEKDTPVYALMDKNSLTTDAKDSNGLRKLTPYLPGGALYSAKVSKEGGTATNQAYADVYLDDSNNYWVKDEPGSQPRMISPKEEYGFMKKIAEANHMSVKNFDKHWQETHPGSNIKNIQADLVVQQQKKAKVLDDFTSKGGDPTAFLKDYKGENFIITEVKNNTETDTRGQLRDITKSGSKYKLVFKYPDGKLKTFDGQTLEEVKKKLSKHDN